MTEFFQLVVILRRVLLRLPQRGTALRLLGHFGRKVSLARAPQKAARDYFEIEAASTSRRLLFRQLQLILQPQRKFTE